MSIYDSSARLGNFTSSEIVALVKTDKKGNFTSAQNYIDECNMERRLGRPLTDECNARPLLWGKLGESVCFDLLPTAYTLFSQETIQHPRHPYWAGSADCLKHDEGKTIVDIKAPYTLKSFCGLVQPLYDGLNGMEAMNQIRETHKDGDKYYWQLISNSILHNTKYAELVIYLPYVSELEGIKARVNGDGKYYFVSMALDNELPCIPDGGYYKNISIIRFEVPTADKEFLFSRVIEAGKLLITKPVKQ